MSKKSTWNVLFASLLLALGACGGDATNAGLAGSMDLNLELAGDVGLDSVDYSITGNGIDEISGTIDVAGQSSIFLQIRRIPQGLGFLLELDAIDGTTVCSASATFDIVAGQVTPVSVVFICDRASDTGGVEVTSTSAQFCPRLTDMSAAMQNNGAAFAMSAAAEDEDGDLITFAWSAPSGSFDAQISVDSAAASTTFTCAVDGDVELTLSVSDDGFAQCDDSASIEVTCAETGSTTVAMMGTTFTSLTLGAGDPNETTISSVAGIDHGSTTGHTAWISTYDSASEIQWGAAISAGDAGGTGFATITAADHDEVGNIYVTLQADMYPGALTLTSADNSTIQYTPPIDAGGNHYGVAKISSAGIWEWYQPIERATGAGTGTYTRPAAVSVYGGRVYVSAREGRMEAGQSLRYANQTGITFPNADYYVHPMIVLDADTGTYILHRIDGSTNYHTIWRNDFGADPPPTTGAVGATGWYSGTSSPSRNVNLVLNYGEVGSEVTKPLTGRAGAHTLRDAAGNVVWSYLHSNSGISSPQHYAHIGATLETGDGAIFIGGIEGGSPPGPPFSHAGGTAFIPAWPGPSGENKGQYLVRYDVGGTIQWLSVIYNGFLQLIVTQGRPVNRSALYDATSDRLYVVYAMPPYDVRTFNDSTWGTRIEQWEDDLLFGPGESTETVIQHDYPPLSSTTGPRDAVIVLASYDASNGAFLWATSHRRPGPDLFLDETGPGGLYLDNSGGIVMLLGSGSGTTSFEDNGTPQPVLFSDAVISAVTHDVVDGSVTSIVEVESAPPTGTWEVTGTLAITQ